MLELGVTSFAFGSGGSGGVFSPSLFMGATLGAVYGGLLNLLPASIVSPPVSSEAFAIAGMAGVVGGSTGAAVTAIVVFEMTRDYNVVIPMTLTVAVSFGLRKIPFHRA